LEAVQDQPVVVAVRLRMHDDGAVDALLIHPAEVVAQRVRAELRGLRLIDGPRMEGVARQVRAEDVGVPLDDHRCLGSRSV
jgi:hypothetical protein